MLGKALGINFPSIIDHFVFKKFNQLVIVVEESKRTRKRWQESKEPTPQLKKKNTQGNQETEP